MKIIRKIGVLLLATVLVATAAAAAGCGEKISKDPNTVNIRVYKAGYGDNHLRMLIAKFEELYAEENYKINIVQSDSSVVGSTVTNELALGTKNGIDMYFPGNLSPGSIAQSSLAEGWELAENLNDLFDENPVGADGVAETGTIRSKMRKGQEGHATYHDYKHGKYDGSAYMFPMYTGVMSLIVNEELLAEYDLDVPRTSRELIECFDVISMTQEATGVYPVAWAGGNAAPYWRGLSDAWAAQYDGADVYQDWVSLNVEDTDDALKLYTDHEGWKYSLTAMETMVNLDYASLGTITQQHTNAQHSFLTGKAAFYVCGAWLQTEMEKNYGEQAKKMRMVTAPIISELGVKIGLGGTVAQSDPILSAIVKGIDEGKDNAAIRAELASLKSDLTDTQIEEVREAKKIVYNRIIFDGAVISATSKKKDICKKFLQLIASDDGIQIMYDQAACISAYYPAGDVVYGDKGAFVESVRKIIEDPDTVLIHRLPNGSSLRADMQLGWFYNEAGVSYSDFTETPMAQDKNLKGADIWKNSQTYADENWTELLRKAGF